MKYTIYQKFPNQEFVCETRHFNFVNTFHLSWKLLWVLETNACLGICGCMCVSGRKEILESLYCLICSILTIQSQLSAIRADCTPTAVFQKILDPWNYKGHRRLSPISCVFCPLLSFGLTTYWQAAAIRTHELCQTRSSPAARDPGRHLQLHGHMAITRFLSTFSTAVLFSLWLHSLASSRFKVSLLSTGAMWFTVRTNSTIWHQTNK